MKFLTPSLQVLNQINVVAKWSAIAALAMLLQACVSSSSPTLESELLPPADGRVDSVEQVATQPTVQAQSEQQNTRDFDVVPVSEGQTAFGPNLGVNAQKNASQAALNDPNQIIGKGGTKGRVITPVKAGDIPENSIATKDWSNFPTFEVLAPTRSVKLKNAIQVAQTRAELLAAAKTQGQSNHATSLEKSRILRQSLQALGQRHGAAALREIESLCTTSNDITSCDVDS